MSGRPAMAASATSTLHPRARKTRSGSTRSPSAMPWTKRSIASRVTASATSMAVHSPRLWPTTTSGRTFSAPRASVSSRPTYMMLAPCALEVGRAGHELGADPEVGGDVVDPGLERGLDAGEGERHEPARRDQALGGEPHVVAPAPRLPAVDDLAGQLDPLGRGVGDGQPQPAGRAQRRQVGTGEHRVVVGQLGGHGRQVVPGGHEQPGGLVVLDRRAGAGRRRRGRPQRTAGASSWSPAGTAAPSSPRAANGSAPDGPAADPFEDHVGVDAAEAEGVDRRPGAGRRRRPTARAAPTTVEAAGAEVGVRLLAVQRRRARPGGAAARADLMSPAMPLAGMAWPMFDFTEPSPTGGSAEPSAARRRGAAWRSRRCRRSGWPSRAPRSGPTLAGSSSGRLPGPLDGEHLALAGRAHERGGPAVARHAGPADDGVDPVAVAPASASRLSTTMPGALADEDAVGPPCRTGGSRRLGLSALSCENTLHRVTSWQWWTPPASIRSRAARRRARCTACATASSERGAGGVERCRRGRGGRGGWRRSDATRFGTSPIDASGCDGPSACWNWSRMASSRSSPRSGTSSRTHATSWWAVRTRCSSRAVAGVR